MSLFGTATAAASSGGLFGSAAATPAKSFSFASLNTNNQPAAQSNASSLFGAVKPAAAPAAGTSLFGSLAQNSTQQPASGGGGLFSGLNQNQSNQQQPQQPTTSLFGGQSSTNQTQQPQQSTGGLFGSTFGQSIQQNNANSGLFSQSSNQNNNANTGGFGFQAQSSTQQQQSQQLPALRQSMYTPTPQADASIPGQITKIQNQWDTGHPDCAFRAYFYNKVDENQAPFYRPTHRDDPKAWDIALSNKPGPGYIPVICIGFAEMSARLNMQAKNLAEYNTRLHQINDSLEAMLSKHDLVVSVRALDARRRHTVLKQRAMQLASRVQILRNRGYALGGDEEDLKTKLQTLERGVLDPGLGARGEEIWARMVGVRERARILKEEVGRRADASDSGIDEDTARRAEKILEDYGKQLGHLKKELSLVTEELKAWEQGQATSH